MRFLGVLILLTLGLRALAAGDPAAAGRSYAEGVAAEGQKDYRQAAGLFEAAALADPGNAPAFRHLGNCRYYLNEKAEALSAYEASLRLQPGDAQLRAFVEGLRARTAAPTPVATALPAPEGKAPKGIFPLEPPEGGGFVALSGWQAGASSRFNLYLLRSDGKEPRKLNAEPFGQEVVEVTGLAPGRKYSFRTVAVLSGLETNDTLPFTKNASEAPSAARWLSPRDGSDLAEGTKVPLLYDFTAAWCGPCKRLEKEVFEDPESAAWLNRHFILVRAMDRRAEDGSNEVRVQNLQMKYHVEGYPTVLVNYRNGKDDRFVGYRGKEGTLALLQEFAAKAASK